MHKCNRTQIIEGWKGGAAGGLMHSVVTNNTISTFFGLSNTVIKENTGKSFGDHFLNNVFRNDDLKSNNNKNKDLEWVFK